jgi:hypothetical protein
VGPSDEEDSNSNSNEYWLVVSSSSPEQSFFMVLERVLVKLFLESGVVKGSLGKLSCGGWVVI